MKRSILCQQFLADNEVICCSMIDSEDEGRFRTRGCECCKTGLGNTVYDCHGYNDKTNEVVEVGAVCGECMAYFYNGDESEVEGTEDALDACAEQGDV